MDHLRMSVILLDVNLLSDSTKLENCELSIKDKCETFLNSPTPKSKFLVWYSVLWFLSIATDTINSAPDALKYLGFILVGLLLLVGIVWALIYLTEEVYVFLEVVKKFGKKV